MNPDTSGYFGFVIEKPTYIPTDTFFGSNKNDGG